jgi:hypothetical protein
VSVAFGQVNPLVLAHRPASMKLFVPLTLQLSFVPKLRQRVLLYAVSLLLIFWPLSAFLFCILASVRLNARKP